MLPTFSLLRSRDSTECLLKTLSRLSFQLRLQQGIRREQRDNLGPRCSRHKAAGAASEHRDGAHPRRLQLAGHREGGEQGHEARLLDWPTAAADMDRDAGL